MKTKLFYLFLAVFLFSVSGKAQTNAKTSTNTVISLIGPGSPSGSWDIDTDLSTEDGNVYTGVDLQLRDGAMQFRSDNGWTGLVYTPTVAGTGFPSGSGLSTGISSPAIPSPGGVYTVTFTKSTQSWEFVPGTPNTVVQLTGTAVTGSPVTMSTNDGVKYFLKKVALVAANCQFDIDENGATTTGLVGGTTFPNGLAQSPTDNIPVDVAADYDVTFDMTDGAYTFTLASFPIISIVGDGAGGWGTLLYPMTTTDGVTYTLNYIPLTDGLVKFRQDNAWLISYGGDTWPSGTSTVGNIPSVAGYYNVTFNRTTGAYSFLPHTISIVGDGVGGWAVNTFTMSTVDGENYTLNGLVVLDGLVKFRENHAWKQSWGGAAWPSGASTSGNIPSVAGTYNVSFNRLTGAYDFGTALAVKNFNAGSFKAYPNPTQNSWTISSGTNKITSVHVYDMLGRSVYTKATSSNDVSVNASSLSKGTYFAKVSTESGTLTVKLIKE
jgi:hypothetical protein